MEDTTMTQKTYIQPEVQIISVTMQSGILATSGERLMQMHNTESEQW